MSGDRPADRTAPRREAPLFTGDPHDEYVYRVVNWLLGVTAGVLVLGGAAIILLTLMFTDGTGAGTPLPHKIAFIVGGLSVLVGIGFALGSTGVPAPASRTYRSPR